MASRGGHWALLRHRLRSRPLSFLKR